jgi:hypothetical protein
MFEGLSWEISTVTTTSRDDDGFPRVQLDGNSERGGSQHFELQHAYGFYSRPRDPEVDAEGIPIAGSCCTLLVDKDAEHWYGFLGIDPRYLQEIPILAPGGASMYAVVLDDDGNVRAPFCTIDGDDGTYQLYIPLKNQQAHQITVGYDGDGEEFISIAHADGHAINMTNDGVVTIKNPAGDSYVSVGPEGIVLSGNVTVVGGLNTGGAAAQPLVTQAGLQIVVNAILAAIQAISAGGIVNGPGAISVAEINALIAPSLTSTVVTNITKGL